MTCNADLSTHELRHEPYCEHMIPCLSCGMWWRDRKTRFPSDSVKICFDCFDTDWREIIKNLDIDWESIEREVNGV